MSGSSQSSSEGLAANPALQTGQSDAAALPTSSSSLWGRLLSVVVSVALVAWLLWPYRTAEARAVLVDAFARASWWAVGVALIGAVFVWISDAYATARTFQRWGTQISVLDTCLVRGATLPFDLINPTLGQAVLAVVMHRRGIPFSRVLVIVLLLNVIFCVHIAIISGAGLLAGASPDAGLVAILVGAALALTVVYLIIVAVRPAVLARQETLRWLMDAGLSGHGWAFLYRLPNMVLIIVFQVLFMRCFGIELPLTVALFYLPTVMFIAGVPISVQGLGPAQMAMVAFFAGYVGAERPVAEATVLACGFAGVVLNNLGALLIGLGCLATQTGRQSLLAVRKPAR
jgi:hypothetical protein